MNEFPRIMACLCVMCSVYSAQECKIGDNGGVVTLQIDKKSWPQISIGVSAFDRDAAKKAEATLPGIRADSWIGSDVATKYDPKNRITYIHYEANGAKFDVVPTAFVFLTNAGFAKLTKDGEAYVLTIDGGDAGSSWESRLWFKDHRLIRRIIINPEFPEIILEDTKYGYNDGGK